MSWRCIYPKFIVLSPVPLGEPAYELIDCLTVMLLKMPLALLGLSVAILPTSKLLC